MAPSLGARTAVFLALVCIGNDLIFIGFDAWNQPALLASVFLAPYLVVKGLNVLVTLTALVPYLLLDVRFGSGFRWLFSVALTLLASLHVESGLLVAASGDGFASPNHIFRVLVYYSTACTFLELRALNTWIAAFVAFAPLVLVPIGLRYAGPYASWEQRHAGARFDTFEAELWALACFYVFLTLRNGWELGKSAAAHRATCLRLIAQASKSQALLETAMPRSIARALISGVPAAQLTRSFSSASIAFVALTDFEQLATKLEPHELLYWLDACYSTFDRLIDLYGEAINKIETVSNVYLVSSGLPLEDPAHHVALANFCADVLELCSNIMGSTVNVKIGINSGPVTAGIIGQSRRFYRVFGDTVNVASRMMSTGSVNRIHCSEAVALALAKSEATTNYGLITEHRGKTFVKGKGDLDTFWLTRLQSESDGHANTMRDSLADLRVTAAQPSRPADAALGRGAHMLNAIVRGDVEQQILHVPVHIAAGAAGMHPTATTAAIPAVSVALQKQLAEQRQLTVANKKTDTAEDVSLFIRSPRARLHTKANPRTPHSASAQAAGASAGPLASAAFNASSRTDSRVYAVPDMARSMSYYPPVPPQLHAEGEAQPRRSNTDHSGAYLQSQHPLAVDEWVSRLDGSAWQPSGLTAIDAASAANAYMSRFAEFKSRDSLNAGALQATATAGSIAGTPTHAMPRSGSLHPIPPAAPKSTRGAGAHSRTVYPKPPLHKAASMGSIGSASHGAGSATYGLADAGGAVERLAAATPKALSTFTDVDSGVSASLNNSEKPEFSCDKRSAAAVACVSEAPGALDSAGDIDGRLSQRGSAQSEPRPELLVSSSRQAVDELAPASSASAPAVPQSAPSAPTAGAADRPTCEGHVPLSAAAAAPTHIPAENPSVVTSTFSSQSILPPLKETIDAPTTSLGSSQAAGHDDSSYELKSVQSSRPRSALKRAVAVAMHAVASSNQLLPADAPGAQSGALHRRVSIADLLRREGPEGFQSPNVDPVRRRQAFRLQDPGAPSPSPAERRLPPISTGALGSGARRRSLVVGVSQTADAVLPLSLPSPGHSLLPSGDLESSLPHSTHDVLDSFQPPLGLQQRKGFVVETIDQAPRDSFSSAVKHVRSAMRKASSIMRIARQGSETSNTSGASAYPLPTAETYRRRASVSSVAGVFNADKGRQPVRRASVGGGLLAWRSSLRLTTLLTTTDYATAPADNATTMAALPATSLLSPGVCQVLSERESSEDDLASPARVVHVSNNSRGKISKTPSGSQNVAFFASTPKAGSGGAEFNALEMPVLTATPAALSASPSEHAVDTVLAIPDRDDRDEERSAAQHDSASVPPASTSEDEEYDGHEVALYCWEWIVFPFWWITRAMRGTVMKFSADDLEAQAVAQLRDRSLAMSRRTFVWCGLLALFAAITWLVVPGQQRAGSVGIAPTLVLLACVSFLVAASLHPSVATAMGPKLSVGMRYVPSLVLLSVLVAMCVCIVGVLRPDCSIVIIQQAWDSRSSDAILPLLPQTVAMHFGTFCALKYTAATRVAVLSVFLGLIPAVLAGSTLAWSDGAISWWLVFQLLLAAVGTVGGAYFSEFRQRLLLVSSRAAAVAEAEANEVVSNLLPKPVVKRIISGQEVPSQVHKGVAILYADLVGFTKMSSSLAPKELMEALNTIYSHFDELVNARPGLWKVETIGDAYIVVGGLFDDVVDDDGGGATTARRKSSTLAPLQTRVRAHLENVFGLAHQLQAALETHRTALAMDVHMRIGVHCGDVVTGIVGSLRPRFSVLGLALMIAEHVESMSDSDGVMCTAQAQAAYLASSFAFSPSALTPGPDVARLELLLSRDLESHMHVSSNSIRPAAFPRDNPFAGLMNTTTVGDAALVVGLTGAGGQFTSLEAPSPADGQVFRDRRVSGFSHATNGSGRNGQSGAMPVLAAYIAQSLGQQPSARRLSQIVLAGNSSYPALMREGNTGMDVAELVVSDTHASWDSSRAMLSQRHAQVVGTRPTLDSSRSNAASASAAVPPPAESGRETVTQLPPPSTGLAHVTMLQPADIAAAAASGKVAAPGLSRPFAPAALFSVTAN